MQMIRERLGANRLQILVGLLILTGIGSTILQSAFPDESWLSAAQTALLLVFVLGAVFTINGAFSPSTQRRVLFAVIPAVFSLILGLLIPGLFRFFLGGALGWVLVSQMMLRNTASDFTQEDYKKAIKAMRKQKYDDAIRHMEINDRQRTRCCRSLWLSRSVVPFE